MSLVDTIATDLVEAVAEKGGMIMLEGLFKHEWRSYPKDPDLEKLVHQAEADGFAISQVLVTPTGYRVLAQRSKSPLSNTDSREDR